MKRFDLPDTVAGRRRMVERLDRRAVEEEIKKCGMPEVPEDVDARCNYLRREWGRSSRIHLLDRVGRDAFPASISFFLLATPHGPILFGQIEPGTPPFDAIGRALDSLCPGLHDPRAHPMSFLSSSNSGF